MTSKSLQRLVQSQQLSDSEQSKLGKRIKLIHTNDPYTHLKQGDLGTITDVTELPADMGGNKQIWVRWDSGSSLAMIEGLDQYEILD